MARVRVAVALLLPRRAADEVDGLRRAFGVDTSYIPPHVTLVPPVNVAEADVAEALTVLRSAAASSDLMALDLGPLDTFLPTNPVLFLAVGGDVDALAELRAACRVGPLARDDPRPFVPHVTITRGLRPDDDAAARALLGAYRSTVTVDRLHLLVQVVDPARGRHWVPAADMVLGQRRTIGVGGMPLEITVSRMADPEVRRTLRVAGVDEPTNDPSLDSYVVACRQDDQVVGVAWGSIARRMAALDDIFIPDEWRRQGIGSHLLATLEHEVAVRGASVIEAPTELSSSGFGLLTERGWTERPGPGGTRLWRALGPDGLG